jgi:hypothetical protein
MKREWNGMDDHWPVPTHYLKTARRLHYLKTANWLHYLKNCQYVVLSQKPPKMLCYIKNRQLVALSQKPPNKKKYTCGQLEARLTNGNGFFLSAHLVLFVNSGKMTLDPKLISRD